ncbi:MAG: amidohydrolase [Clostridia bacterium]|nr:amidohydrolase [Clostridia bacterium]
MNLFNEAKAIKDTLVEHRKYLHQNPELGLELPKTAAYVEEQLKKMGYEPQRIGSSGIVATVGKGNGKCFLIRGDMDALPVVEEADVEYKSTNGNMHACGHDCHATAMLGAAQLLKAHEDEIEGTVKLMFQPAEETMDGAKMMVEAGILEGVDAAFGAHVFTNIEMPVGAVLMMGSNAKMAAVDWFTINIQGKGCHGASPHSGVDPLNVMVHIHTALQAINARELDPTDNLVLTIGQMHGGNTSNVIPDTAMMSGTIRTLKNETRAMVKERMEAIVKGVAASLRAEATVEWGSGCPVQFSNKDLYAELKGYMKEMEGLIVVDMDDFGGGMGSMGSEDFAYVSNTIPAVFVGITAGKPSEGDCYPQHHPKANFREDALPTGAAAYAQVAMQWLKNNK